MSLRFELIFIIVFSQVLYLRTGVSCLPCVCKNDGDVTSEISSQTTTLQNFYLNKLLNKKEQSAC